MSSRTIPCVKEDVTEIVPQYQGPDGEAARQTVPKVVYIDAEGEGEVTAGDIKADSEVEILNPTMHIATLASGAKVLYGDHA
jgi:DNA-directed RNA polymerase subunit alpha